MTKESHPFWKGNYSYKFNGPGVRYEVVLNDGNVVRLDGPHRGGKREDFIFNTGTKKELPPGVKCIGDRFYQRNVSEIFTANTTPEEKRFARRVRGRHEGVNGRFKDWGALRQKFRHSWAKHGMVFRAVAVITQIEIENGMTLFDI